MNIDFLDITIIVAITIAIVDLIKKASGDKLGMWSFLISAGVGAAVYAIGLYAPDVVKGFIAVGLVASGIYVTAGKIGKN